MPSAVTRDRFALLVTSSALLVSWFSTPAQPTPSPPADQPAPRSAATAPARDRASALAREVSRETARLAGRLALDPPTPRPGRDPFDFASSRAPAVAPAAPVTRPLPRPAPLADAPEDLPRAAAGPTLRLIGIAERTTPDGVHRSAVLAGASDVYIVSAGEALLARFDVVEVEADAVALRERASGAPVRLVLAR